jgi:hypothetical protein
MNFVRASDVRRWIAVLVLFIFTGPMVGLGGVSAGSSFACPVTRPNGLQPPATGNAYMAGRGDYGNAWLWTSLWIWGEDGVHVPATAVDADGVAQGLKWSWYRFVPGTLSITGRRLDAVVAPPLTAWVPSGYGNRGFQATGVTFPTEGCWEVTGHLGEANLTFVVSVEHLDPSIADVSFPPLTPVDPCPVTQANGEHPPGIAAHPGDHGNGLIWTNLARIVSTPNAATPVAAISTIEIPWFWSDQRVGSLKVSAWRLDGSSPMPQINVDPVTRDGWHVATIDFSHPGCWEVMAQVGPAQLAVIIDV